MSAAKEDLIAALEKSADELEKVLGPAELPDPAEKERWQRLMNDRNFTAKVKLHFVVETFRNRAGKLRRGDISKGDWPPFRPEEAQMQRESLSEIRNRVQAYSSDEEFVKSALKADSPVLKAVEKHAVNERGMWRYREEDCDPMPKFEPPPAPGT